MNKHVSSDQDFHHDEKLGELNCISSFKNEPLPLFLFSFIYFITLFMTKSIHFDKHEFEPIWDQFVGDPAIMGSTQLSTIKIMGSIFQGCLFLGVEILNAWTCPFHCRELDNSHILCYFLMSHYQSLINYSSTYHCHSLSNSSTSSSQTSSRMFYFSIHL